MPTRRPTGDGGLVATISLPLEHGNGNGNGRPTQYPAHHQHNNGPATEANPGGIIASLAHENGQQWTGGDDASPQTTGGSSPQGPNGGDGSNAHTTSPASPQGSTYHLFGTHIVAGASAATIQGTTYSLAPSGEGIFVNGHERTFTGPAATDSVAMAVMSALGGGKARTSDVARTTSDAASSGQKNSSSGSSTMATTTSRGPASGQGSESASAGPAEQTVNGAALVLPGIGLGAVGLLAALL